MGKFCSLMRRMTWTGEEAVSNGLVDHIGGLNDALNYLYRQCNLTESDCDIAVLPRKTYLFENPLDYTGLFDKIIDTFLGSRETILSSDFFDETENIFYRMPYNIEIN